MGTNINPFPTTAYHGPDYFCDREEELKQLKQNIRGGNSTTMVALRRIGKTAMIKHLFHHIKRSYITIYLDILPTESIGELMNRLSTAVAAEVPETSRLGKKIWTFFKTLRPIVSYDSLQGTPNISFRHTEEEAKRSIADLFSILEEQSKPVVIALDEFQQILEYPEKNTDAWLRSLIQQMRNTSFIFAGSQQHLMQELFTNPSRPFFRSTQFLKLDRLPRELYRDFIFNTYQQHKRKVSMEVIEEMLEWTDNYTYYVQLLCNRVYLTSRNTISSEDWKQEANHILKEQEFAFFNYREMLTKPQWELLRAIAREGRVFQPTSAAFVGQHKLGNPATVLRSLNSLRKMDLIHKEHDENGQSYYGIYDLLFRRWIDR